MSRTMRGADTDAYDLRCWVGPAGEVCGCTASDEAALLPFQSAGAPGRGVPLSLSFAPAQSGNGELLLRACPTSTMPARGEPCPAGAKEAVFRAEPTWAALDPTTGCTTLKLSPSGGPTVAPTKAGEELPGRYSYEPALPRYALRVNAL